MKDLPTSRARICLLSKGVCRMRSVFAFLVAAFVACSVSADVLNLKDGTRLEGDVKKSPDGGYVVTAAGGAKVTRVPADAVKSFELSGAAASSKPSAASSSERLASLRRSVEYLDDPRKVVDRYHKFLETNKGTSAEKDAIGDLAVWQDRLDRKMVKVGGKWVTPEERAAMQEQAVAAADAARKLLRDGQLKDAEDAINKAIAEDPTNVAALYLRGLLAYRQDQLIPARKAFESVNALAANHAPTLNNLGVILFRQNQIAGAMGFYDQAMQSSPRNKQVLNNVAEALNAMTEDQLKTQIAQRAARRFTEQDQDLAKDLLQQGLHRWGATWVTADQLDELRQAEQAVRNQLDDLSAQFETTKVRIANIDRDIDENTRAMSRYNAGGYVRGLDGQLYQATPPAGYYTLKDDNDKLARERIEQAAKLDQLRQAAKEIQQKLPVPKYTGIQKLFDIEGTPILPPSPPASKPATLPVTPPATQPLNHH
jgi:Tfp pilus assembly protein PilF